jgi:hypothetical protein
MAVTKEQREIEAQVKEAIEVERAMDGELADQGIHPMTKQEKAIDLLDWIGANPDGVLRCDSGEVTVTTTAGPEGLYTINGKEYGTEDAVKRLMRVRRDILYSLTLYPSPEAADDAQDAHDEKGRERVGLKKIASANGDKRRRSGSGGNGSNRVELPNLREIRKDKGLGLWKLGEAVDPPMTGPSISRLELLKGKASPEQAEAIAKALGINASALTKPAPATADAS